MGYSGPTPLPGTSRTAKCPVAAKLFASSEYFSSSAKIHGAGTQSARTKRTPTEVTIRAESQARAGSSARRTSNRARGACRKSGTATPGASERDKIGTAEEERDDRSEGQERRERDRLLARCQPMPGDDQEPGDPRREQAHEDPEHDRFAEAGSEQQAELDVPQTEPGAVRQKGDQEEDHRPERSDDPLERVLRRDRDLQDEDGGGCRQDDAVGNDPPLEVDRREHREHDHEQRRDERAAGDAELEKASGGEHEGDKDDQHIRHGLVTLIWSHRRQRLRSGHA